MFRSTCLALIALTLPAAGFAAPLELKPSSDWEMSYDMEACRLMRSFGEDDEKVVIHFTRYMPELGLEIIVAGKMLAPRGSSFKYRFAPGDEPNEARNPLFGERDDGVTAWQFNTGLIPQKEYKKLSDDSIITAKMRTDLEQQRAAEIRSFEILRGVQQSVSLATGSMVGAMKAMDTCIDDLVREWGYDPKIQRERLSMPEPKNDPRRWIASNDYPSQALRQRLSGAVRFRLDVDETGEVDGCVIQESFSDPAFREVTCALIEKRARFAPAIGADGKPVRSFWGTAVVFVTG